MAAIERFRDSTDLLDDPKGLLSRFNLDGYVFLKNVVSQSQLTELRQQIVGILASAGWLKQDETSFDATPAIPPYVEGEEEYLRVYNEIQKLQAFHSLPHQTAISDLLKKLLGASAFPHPLSIARLVFPQNDEWSTPPHQDYPNNQGTKDLLACWIPLADCSMEQGSLSILRGSHKYGILPVEFALGAGHRQAVLDQELRKLKWLSGDFELGDLIIFHSLTVHRSLHNSSEHMRLSVDYRFQREHEPLTEPCLHPHFQQLSWEQIYENWSNRDLAYYWEGKTYEVVDWNSELHKIPKEDELESIKQSLRYDRKRERQRSDKD